MFSVESDTEEHGCDRGENQKLEYGDLRDLRPQADDECGRATDNQETADDLAPADVALFHEGVEHFAERPAWCTRLWRWLWSWRRRRRRRLCSWGRLSNRRWRGD